MGNTVNLTEGEVYRFGKIDNQAFILDSSDGAGGAFITRPSAAGSIVDMTEAGNNGTLEIRNSAGNQNVPQLLIHNNSTSALADSYIEFQSQNQGAADVHWSIGIDTNDTTAFKIRNTTSVGGNASVELKTDGSVELCENRVVFGGGNSHGSSATISGNSGDIIFEVSGDSDSMFIQNINSGDYFFGNSQQDNGIAFFDGTGGMRFYYNGEARMHIDNTGGVEIYRDSVGGRALRLEGDGGNFSYILDIASLNSASSVKVVAIAQGSGESETLILESNGDIQHAGSISAISDERMKKNIVSLDSGSLDKVLKLNPINFNWKDEYDLDSTIKKTGFSAQAVEKIFPEMVKIVDDVNCEPRKNGGKGMNTGFSDRRLLNEKDMIPHLVKCIQVLTERVTELENKLGGN